MSFDGEGPFDGFGGPPGERIPIVYDTPADLAEPSDDTRADFEAAIAEIGEIVTLQHTRRLEGAYSTGRILPAPDYYRLLLSDEWDHVEETLDFTIQHMTDGKAKVAEEFHLSAGGVNIDLTRKLSPTVHDSMSALQTAVENAALRAGTDLEKDWINRFWDGVLLVTNRQRSRPRLATFALQLLDTLPPAAPFEIAAWEDRSLEQTFGDGSMALAHWDSTFPHGQDVPVREFHICTSRGVVGHYIQLRPKDGMPGHEYINFRQLPPDSEPITIQGDAISTLRASFMSSAIRKRTEGALVSAGVDDATEGSMKLMTKHLMGLAYKLGQNRRSN